MSKFLHEPGRGWRITRRLIQSLVFIAIIIAPVLGGWQRLARVDLASWDREGAELPVSLQERLPGGEAPARAHALNLLTGGGLAVEYFDIPVVDPVAGALALIGSGVTLRGLVAIGLPLLLAAFAGRLFCGWFCPFGTLSRGVARLINLLPFRVPHLAIPDRRPIRYVLLGASLVAAFFGAHVLFYLFLPHMLIQQSVYAAWLLGGGSAVFAVFVALVVVGLVFGPTTYCSAVCPTGAALALAGTKRLVRLQIAAPASCGPKCENCDRACWLGLDPASGDPGPDCDLCARCVQACPSQNLRVGFGKGHLKSTAAALLVLTSASLLAGTAYADPRKKPVLVLDAEVIVDGVTVAAAVTDMTGVRLDADDEREESGVVLSVFIARGERGPADEFGGLPHREIYTGPLTVHIAGERVNMRVEYEEPNSPVSTPRRAIYRRHLEIDVVGGDVVTIEPVEGWLAEPMTWTVPDPGVRPPTLTLWGYFAAALLFFGGLLSVAFGLGRATHGTNKPLRHHVVDEAEAK
ncbi:MAG: hypothetical protein DRJ42_21475 [Deltaproteobacteria bacterium]|nr:MAG: hypothetical protein DRJ42_21475 [Deltaproteobacteria bacterium]